MVLTVQLDAAARPSKRLIALTKKIENDGMLTKADLTHAASIINDQKNTERAAFVSRLQANESKSQDELMKGLGNLTRPKRTKAGRPKGATAEDHREVVLLAWRLKRQGFNTVEIGQRLNVSNQTAGGYLREAKDLLRVDPATVDIPTEVGDALNFYDEVRAMALRLADREPDPEVKIKALAVALKSQSDRTSFLVRVGVLAPEVAEYFQQMVVQQYILAGKKGDPIEDFFGAVADDLREHARQVMDGEIIDGGVGS